MTPRVFISYSHDSAEHKGWVLDFATTLRDRGVDAVLDQWDLKPGGDLPHFMETELERCDKAVMVCTNKYVEKANDGAGGVGYEKMIMTASMLKKIDDNKVIPIVREQSDTPVPTFLSSKLYIDFSNDDEVEYSLDDLLRTLLDAPLYEKPEIGTNPFKPLSESKPDRTSDGVKQAMMAVSEAFNNSQGGYRFVFYRDVIKFTKMHRLTLDKYISMAQDVGLIKLGSNHTVYVTDGGLEYLTKHGIINP